MIFCDFHNSRCDFESFSSTKHVSEGGKILQKLTKELKNVNMNLYIIIFSDFCIKVARFKGFLLVFELEELGASEASDISKESRCNGEIKV